MKQLKRKKSINKKIKEKEDKHNDPHTQKNVDIFFSCSTRLGLIS